MTNDVKISLNEAWIAAEMGQKDRMEKLLSEAQNKAQMNNYDTSHDSMRVRKKYEQTKASLMADPVKMKQKMEENLTDAEYFAKNPNHTNIKDRPNVIQIVNEDYLTDAIEYAKLLGIDISERVAAIRHLLDVNYSGAPKKPQPTRHPIPPRHYSLSGHIKPPIPSA